jgi:hypothetical protein
LTFVFAFAGFVGAAVFAVRFGVVFVSSALPRSLALDGLPIGDFLMSGSGAT